VQIITPCFIRRLKINHKAHWVYAFVLEIGTVANNKSEKKCQNKKKGRIKIKIRVKMRCLNVRNSFSIEEVARNILFRNTLNRSRGGETN
jgi:hypothetical protein